MNTWKDYLYITISTVYQISLLIILGTLIYPVFKIIGNLADGITINIVETFSHTFNMVYSKLKSGLILKMTAALVFIRLIGVYWLTSIKKTNSSKP